MKRANRLLAMAMALCLVLSLIPAIELPTKAATDTHTIVLSSTQNSDGSYAHSVLYDGAEVTEYDYTWHADPSTVHDEVKNSPAEYFTGTQPGSEAVYVAHDIYYYPELNTSGFTKMNYDGEQEWVYYYTAEGYTGYIFSTLPGRSSLPTDMMHSAEDAYQNAVLHITQPGRYTIQGNWHGQIWVDLENYCDDPFTDPTAKVELVLNGVDIECTVAPGVVFYNVYECDNTWEDQSSWSHIVDTTDAGATVTLVDGTVNNVSGKNIFRILKTQYKSGSTSVQKKRLKIDGAFYSYQSMKINGQAKGTGVLNITSGFEGLDSELHLTLNSGNVYINSQDDGINVNEDNVSVLTINGGNLHILAGLGQEGDGIDSNGFICVNGGTTISMANPGSDSGMDSDFGTYVFAGNVVALGSTMDWATNDSSVTYTHSTMNLQFSSSKSAGDAIIITDTAGNGIFAYDPDKDEITGTKTRTYTGAIVSCDAFEIGQSYNVYIGGEVTGTETMGVYDMSTVTGVSSTYQQSYGGTSTGGSSNRPGRPGSSGSTSTGTNTTFTFTSNVNKFSGVGNYGSATNITVIPQEAPEEEVTEKTYYLFGYINGANYACEDDYENMGIYQFVDGQLVTSFDSDSYIAVKEQDNANWYMFQSYCTDTTGTLYDTDTGAGEKMFVPANAEITFTLAENADGTLTLSYTAVPYECSHSYTAQITTDATCTTDGVRTYTCSLCGDGYTESIAATGHSYSSEVTAPSCTESGYTTYTCANCGDSYIADTIPATGHSYSNGVCTACGEVDESYGNAESDFVLVTDISQITSGGQFVIVALSNGSYKAMGTTLSSGKIAGVDITVSENMAIGENLPVWTITPVDGGIALSVDGSYLNYNSSTNFKMADAAYAWTVAAGDSGFVFDTTAESRGIYYRINNDKFGAYSNTNASSSSYVSNLLVFKYKEDETSCTHNYVDGTCTKCGEANPNYTPVAMDYYLIGYINGANYGCEEDSANLGEYKFVDGKLVATFAQDSYVFIKTGDNSNWYMTTSYVTDTTATLINTNEGGNEKMFVPGGVEVTFTLVVNSDDTLTLSYTTGSSSVTVPTLTLKYPTLSFEDVIYYNVYFDVDKMDSVVEMGLITFDEKLADGTIDNAVDVIAGYISNADGSYTAHTNGVPAKKLGDALYFKAYAKLSDGTYAYSEIAGYHAVLYADSVLSNTSVSTESKALVVAMLNYGAAAQVYFDYKTDSLMNAGLTAEQQALVSAYSESMVATVEKPDATKCGVFVNNGGYSQLYPTVSFEGAFSINYKIEAKYAVDNGVTFYYWDAATYNSVDVLTTANATGSYKLTIDGNMYTGAVEGIAAKQLDEAVYVAAVYTSGGTTYYTPIVSYSLGTYCKTIAESGEAFGEATAVYGYYAKAFFA